MFRSGLVLAWVTVDPFWLHTRMCAKMREAQGPCAKTATRGSFLHKSAGFCGDMQLKPGIAQNLAVSCLRKISRKTHNVQSRKFNAPPKSRRIWRKNGDSGSLPARIRAVLREYAPFSPRKAAESANVEKSPRTIRLSEEKAARKEGSKKRHVQHSCACARAGGSSRTTKSEVVDQGRQIRSSESFKK